MYKHTLTQSLSHPVTHAHELKHAPYLSLLSVFFSHSHTYTHVDSIASSILFLTIYFLVNLLLYFCPVKSVALALSQEASDVYVYV